MPFAFPALNGSVRITLLLNLGFALDANGAVRVFGTGSSATAGLGETGPTPIPPTRINGLDPVKRLATGPSFTCALQVNDAVRCWGINSRGQVGTGTTEAVVYEPTPVAPIQL